MADARALRTVEPLPPLPPLALALARQLVSATVLPAEIWESILAHSLACTWDGPLADIDRTLGPHLAQWEPRSPCHVRLRNATERALVNFVGRVVGDAHGHDDDLEVRALPALLRALELPSSYAVPAERLHGQTRLVRLTRALVADAAHSPPPRRAPLRAWPSKEGPRRAAALLCLARVAGARVAQTEMRTSNAEVDAAIRDAFGGAAVDFPLIRRQIAALGFLEARADVTAAPGREIATQPWCLVLKARAARREYLAMRREGRHLVRAGWVAPTPRET